MKSLLITTLMLASTTAFAGGGGLASTDCSSVNTTPRFNAHFAGFFSRQEVGQPVPIHSTVGDTAFEKTLVRKDNREERVTFASDDAKFVVVRADRFSEAVVMTYKDRERTLKIRGNCHGN